MSHNEYVDNNDIEYVEERTPEDESNSNEDVYFSNCGGLGRNKPCVSVQHSEAGVYDIAGENIDSKCLYSIEYRDEPKKSKGFMVWKHKKLATVAIFIILAIILCLIFSTVFTNKNIKDYPHGKKEKNAALHKICFSYYF